MSFYQQLVFRDVNFKNTNEELVFDNISMNLPLNAVNWVTGSEGSGRSLFLKLLNGLALPSSGCIELNGVSISDMYFEDIQGLRLKSGYSFDFGGLISNRTLFENIFLPLQYHSIMSGNQAKNKVLELAEIFKISQSLLSSRPAEVRGSIRKATCLARAFVFDPELILLDDPTTGLNSQMRSSFKSYLKTLASDGSRHIFVATDDVDFISDMTDNSIYIDNGKIALSLKDMAA